MFPQHQGEKCVSACVCAATHTSSTKHVFRDTCVRWYRRSVSIFPLSVPAQAFLFAQKYPLDSQQCALTLFPTSGETALLSWDTVPVTMGDEDQFNLGSLALSAHSAEDCSSGGATCLRVIFRLKRQIGYFLMQVSGAASRVKVS